MRRLFIVYNRRSSRYLAVDKEVLIPARKLKGFILCKYEVEPTSIMKNARKLAKLLENGDILITAGGDGTASIGLNAIMLSKKEIVFSALGFGNFNDLSNTLGNKTFLELIKDIEKTTNFYPLEVRVNNQLWRYAGCYVTIGLFAESTKIFDTKKVRKKLQKGNRSLIFSIKSLAAWYFKNHKNRVFLSDFILNGQKCPKNTTDYLAINSKTIAKIMKGGNWYKTPNNFLSATASLNSLPRLLNFMCRSIFKGIKGSITTSDTLEFYTPSSFEIQAEGEYEQLKNVTKITIKKSSTPIKVIV